MTRFAACVVLLCVVSPASYADWRIDAFSKAQALMRQFEEKEAALMTELSPETKEFFALWLPARESRRRIEDLAFRWHLDHDAASVAWDNPLVWSQGVQSSDDEKRLVAEDADFSKAYEDYRVKRALLLSHKELFKIRNAAHERQKELFQKLEFDLQTQLNLLQREVDKNKKII